MEKNIFILKHIDIAFELNVDKEVVYFYHLSGSGEVDEHSKSILVSINNNIASAINKYFNSDIETLGVKILETQSREITTKEKEEIYSHTFEKYLFTFFTMAIFAMMIFYEPISEYEQRGLSTLSSIALLGVFFALTLTIGKEQYEVKQLKNKLLFNITTQALPSQEDNLDILEKKIDQLLQEKKELQSKI